MPNLDVPHGGVTVRRLRGIRFGDLQTRARKWIAFTYEQLEGLMFPAGWATEATRRSGPQGKPDVH
jgi:hypothetical protein